MRTDKEQLELIYQKAAERQAAITRRRCIVGMALSIALCVLVLTVASIVSPKKPDISQLLAPENGSESIGDNVMAGQSSNAEGESRQDETDAVDSGRVSSEEYVDEESDFSDYFSSDSVAESTPDGTETESSSVTSGNTGGNGESTEQSGTEQSDTEQSETGADVSFSESSEDSAVVSEPWSEAESSSCGSSAVDAPPVESVPEQSEEGVESAESAVESSVEIPSESNEEVSTDGVECPESADVDSSNSEEGGSLSGWGSDISVPPESRPDEESGEESNDESVTEEQPLPAPETIYVLAPDDYSRDFYARLERAEGSIPVFIHMPYRDNLGTALAWQMYQSVNTGFYYFNTVLSFDGAVTEAEVLSAFSALGVSPIAYAYLESGLCYAMLDSLSVVSLASSGVYCYALGSGYDAASISPDTDEGIAAFCNTYGDLYVSDNEYVNASVVRHYYLNCD